MSALGHSLPMRLVSALHDVRSTQKADIKFQPNICRDGPICDIGLYSITATAGAGSVCGKFQMASFKDTSRVISPSGLCFCVGLVHQAE